MGQVYIPSSGGGSGPITGGARVSFVLLAGANNNVQPVGFAPNVGRVDLDSTAGIANLTGFIAGADGQLVTIRVLPGGNNVTLNNQNAGSFAANQFSSSDDLVLVPGMATDMQYYAGSINNWILIP